MTEKVKLLFSKILNKRELLWVHIIQILFIFHKTYRCIKRFQNTFYSKLFLSFIKYEQWIYGFPLKIESQNILQILKFVFIKCEVFLSCCDTLISKYKTKITYLNTFFNNCNQKNTQRNLNIMKNVSNDVELF